MKSDVGAVGITVKRIMLEKWKGDDHTIPPFEKIILENDVKIYHELYGKVILDRRK